MKNLSAAIGWLLLTVALAIYVYGIYTAILNPFAVKSPTGGPDILKMPEALETVTTTIGAILLTNLGVVLGISMTNRQSGLANIAFLSAKVDLPDPVTQRELIQFVAVLIYIVTLIACGVDWAVHTFKEKPDAVVELIPQYGKTLLGVITAYLAFVLSVKQ